MIHSREDGSVVKVLDIQTSGPEFKSPDPVQGPSGLDNLPVMLASHDRNSRSPYQAVWGDLSKQRALHLTERLPQRVR